MQQDTAPAVPNTASMSNLAPPQRPHPVSPAKRGCSSTADSGTVEKRYRVADDHQHSSQGEEHVSQ